MKYFNFKNSEHLKYATCKKTLGHGGFANVKLFECNDTHNDDNIECNKLFVLKELKMDFGCFNREDMILKYNAIHSMLLNEYKIGSKLDHHNIMKIIDIDERANCLMLEHIVGTDLLDYLNLKGCEDGEYLMTSFYYVLDALEYMHDIGVAHRDIKLENILLDMKNDTVKIIDFGQSFEFKKDNEYIYAKDICGTEGYFPPEYYNSLEYMPDKVDVWCCGVVLYNLIFDCMPWEHPKRSKDDIYARCYYYFKDNQLEPNVFNPKKYKIKVKEEDIPIINDIFKSIFKLEPSKRTTIKDIKEKVLNLSLCQVEYKK